MSDPTPARRVDLRWSEAVPDDRVVDAAADVHQGLAGETLELGTQVEPIAGVPLVVVDTDPRGEPVQVDGDTVVELERPPGEGVGGAEVVVLVDASYSMRGGDGAPAWDRARQAAVAFLASGRPMLVRAGLVAFTHEPRVLAELGDPADADPDLLDAVEPRGQSDPGAALEWAVRTLHYEGDPGNHRAAVLVTDDAPADGVDEAGRRAANLGIAVHAARLDPPTGDDPLEEAAARSGGTYQAGEPPDTLKPALEAVARAVDASVNWTAPAGTDADETAFEVILKAATDEEDFP